MKTVIGGELAKTAEATGKWRTLRFSVQAELSALVSIGPHAAHSAQNADSNASNLVIVVGGEDGAGKVSPKVKLLLLSTANGIQTAEDDDDAVEGATELCAGVLPKSAELCGSEPRDYWISWFALEHDSELAADEPPPPPIALRFGYGEPFAPGADGARVDDLSKVGHRSQGVVFAHTFTKKEKSSVGSQLQHMLVRTRACNGRWEPVSAVASGATATRELALAPFSVTRAMRAAAEMGRALAPARTQRGVVSVAGGFSCIYRYILRESCSQFDSLPLTSLTLVVSVAGDAPLGGGPPEMRLAAVPADSAVCGVTRAPTSASQFAGAQLAGNAPMEMELVDASVLIAAFSPRANRAAATSEALELVARGIPSALLEYAPEAGAAAAFNATRLGGDGAGEAKECGADAERATKMEDEEDTKSAEPTPPLGPFTLVGGAAAQVLPPLPPAKKRVAFSDVSDVAPTDDASASASAAFAVSPIAAATSDAAVIAVADAESTVQVQCADGVWRGGFERVRARTDASGAASDGAALAGWAKVRRRDLRLDASGASHDARKNVVAILRWSSSPALLSDPCATEGIYAKLGLVARYIDIALPAAPSGTATSAPSDDVWLVCTQPAAGTPSYYHNTTTGASVWTLPATASGWLRVSRSGEDYWYDPANGKSAWQVPSGATSGALPTDEAAALISATKSRALAALTALAPRLHAVVVDYTAIVHFGNGCGASAECAALERASGAMLAPEEIAGHLADQVMRAVVDCGHPLVVLSELDLPPGGAERRKAKDSRVGDWVAAADRDAIDVRCVTPTPFAWRQKGAATRTDPQTRAESESARRQRFDRDDGPLLARFADALARGTALDGRGTLRGEAASLFGADEVSGLPSTAGGDRTVPRLATWAVVYSGGVRVRAAPSLAAAEVDVKACECEVRGDMFVTVTDEGDWIRLSPPAPLDPAALASRAARLASTGFAPGDRVRVKKSVKKPKHGWGRVTHADVGVVSTASRSILNINFGSKSSSWSAAADELEFADSSDSWSRADSPRWMMVQNKVHGGEPFLQLISVEPLNASRRVASVAAAAAARQLQAAAAALPHHSWGVGHALCGWDGLRPGAALGTGGCGKDVAISGASNTVFTVSRSGSSTQGARTNNAAGWTHGVHRVAMKWCRSVRSILLFAPFFCLLTVLCLRYHSFVCDVMNGAAVLGRTVRWGSARPIRCLRRAHTLTQLATTRGRSGGRKTAESRVCILVARSSPRLRRRTRRASAKIRFAAWSWIWTLRRRRCRCGQARAVALLPTRRRQHMSFHRSSRRRLPPPAVRRRASSFAP